MNRPALQGCASAAQVMGGDDQEDDAEESQRHGAGALFVVLVPLAGRLQAVGVAEEEDRSDAGNGRENEQCDDFHAHGFLHQ
ncbi:MAG: hypothetical protein C0507_25035 [Cyanobacteria bacterium PR.3.49]|nr:hypothetical protein [Cyanobacteria bacterium PR.3.49]